MPVATEHWLQVVGFTLAHTPGIARAWRYEFADGSYLLVTNGEGYDLPEPGGPYFIARFSRHDEVLTCETESLPCPQDLYRFVQSQKRQVQFLQDHPSH